MSLTKRFLEAEIDAGRLAQCPDCGITQAPHLCPQEIYLFSAQQHAITPGALDYLTRAEVAPQTLLDRHYRCDWSELDEHDTRANFQGLKQGLRIFTSYTIEQQKIWIITEADRSVTTILLPSEY